MATVLKCKMCGGSISVNADMTIGTCQYCGSTMPLPRIDSDKRARMFTRANQSRLSCEFDKAYDAYKTIAEEDEQESEAYWGMILSEYGVEYVEDPKSHQRIPTCHRTCVQSVRASANFKLAIKYADSERKFIYQDEAEVIDKLQRSILAVSSREEPYDVFICYKESDSESGERTNDSVIAQSIFHELEKNEIRTFFSRISLENHLGENYEPYIYSALKSAKIMLLVTTSGENCDSVWVKNEWSRYLHFMSEDDSKVFIPVFSEMSPYELPEELSGFQAQNMEKVGAIQDLVYGIKKILGTTKTFKNDITIQALVEDKLKREKKEELEKIENEKKKKRYKMIISSIAVIVCVALLATGICLANRINKERQLEEEKKQSEELRQYWAERISNNRIIVGVGDTVPSSDDYDVMTLEITKENFFDYFEFKKFKCDGMNCFYLKNKLYDSGWIYQDANGGLIYDGGGGEFVISREGQYRLSSDDDLFPMLIFDSKNKGLEMKFRGFDNGGTISITFVSKNAVEKYDLYSDDSNEWYRTIETKDGNSKTSHILDSRLIPESIIRDNLF